MKKVLVILAVIVVVGYLLFSASFFKEKPLDDTCNSFDIVISNASNDQFVDIDQVHNIVKEKGLDPLNKFMREVNTIEIEKIILINKHIKKAEVFKTNTNGIRVVLEERKPIMRIIPEMGESYYIDSDGKKMPLSRRYTAYLPIATGKIKDAFAEGDLYKFALFLQKDEFWNAQIEQIIVKANEDVEFIPRVGNQLIVLGSLDSFNDKLEKLFHFYKEGLNRIGWNKYSVINLKYDKQVVCTKQ